MDEALRLAAGLTVLVLSSPGELLGSTAQSQTCGSRVRAVAVNDTELHYFECGSGDPVIFVHGSTGDLTWAAPHAAALSDDFRSISYSRRFHAPNDPPSSSDEYSMETHVADLAALIRELDLAPAHIVGHSYGAYVALVLAVERPELVRSLVLGEPPVLPLLNRTAVGKAILDSWHARIRDPARAAVGSGELTSAFRRFLDAVVGPGWFDQLPPDGREALVSDAGPEFALELTTDETTYMPPISCTDLSKIDEPTLLLTGENSIVSLLLITAELEECLNAEEHAMIPNAGHVMFTNAGYFDEQLRAFLVRFEQGARERR